MMTAPSPDEEWRKRITAQLIEGQTVAIIDNVEQPLGSLSLSAVLTSPVWADRLLGQSEIARVPHRVMWLATGNNIRLKGDVPRRSVWCRLDAKMERPWQRVDFKHPDLLGWIEVDLGRLPSAALTVARVWITEGMPSFSGPPLGSLESWSRSIGGILEVAGITGFLEDFNDL